MRVRIQEEASNTILAFQNGKTEVQEDQRATQSSYCKTSAHLGTGSGSADSFVESAAVREDDPEGLPFSLGCHLGLQIQGRVHRLQ